MTRERRLAIELWKQIVKTCEKSSIVDIPGIKESFCTKHQLKWKNNCWFCQYVRKDYRFELDSRSKISLNANCCFKCPLYKYSKKQYDWGDWEDNCGCSSYDAYTWSLWERVSFSGDAEAAKLILRALKGEEDINEVAAD